MPVTFSSPIVVRPYELEWFEVELPEPGPYEVVYRNRACLICGSDLHHYKGLHPFAPLPACCGHEVAADVVEVGSKVTHLAEGDRVYVSGTGASPVPCGKCLQCVRGEASRCENKRAPVSFSVEGKPVSRFPSGFGEYTYGHVASAYRLPDNVSYYEAAVATDLAYVIGVVRRSGAGLGDTAAVLGAGPIGLRTLEVVRNAGVSKVIVSEPVGYRLDRAEALGADVLVDPLASDPVESVLAATGGDGVDYVFDTAGSLKATAQGLRMLRTGMGGLGTLVLMGLYEDPALTVDLSDLMHRAGRIIAEWGIWEGRSGNVRDALHL
ncbi:alcohol dehydrogenase catalytic domain-containing protein, partial [Candidatus Bathyarchaeota archaeon]|nr:alcohol dehydrogenase catalytic domain-containing protein [Candidatus Bathyarchaeota archaeon]